MQDSRERGPPLRRRPVPSGQEGADRVSRDPVTERDDPYENPIDVLRDLWSRSSGARLWRIALADAQRLRLVQDRFSPSSGHQVRAEYATSYADEDGLRRRSSTSIRCLPTELAKITPENLAALDQEQIDQIYARLTAGPIPDGAFDGRILLPRGMSGKFRVAEIAGGFAGMALHLKGLKVETLGETLWKGKVFFRDERVLRNRIEDLDALQANSASSKATRSKIAVSGKETWLLFPGQALLRPEPARCAARIDHHRLLLHRRDSRLPGEARFPRRPARTCACATRSGWYVPASILAARIWTRFSAELHVYNNEIAKRDGDAFARTGAVKEDCYTGTQQRVVTAGK